MYKKYGTYCFLIIHQKYWFSSYFIIIMSYIYSCEFVGVSRAFYRQLVKGSVDLPQWSGYNYAPKVIIYHANPAFFLDSSGKCTKPVVI